MTTESPEDKNRVLGVAPGSQAGDELDDIIKDLVNFLKWESEQDWEPDYDREANRQNSVNRTIQTLEAYAQKLADEQYKIGLKNGRFGYIPKRDAERLATERAIEELRQHRNYSLDIDESEDYQLGFEDALDQVAAANARRVKELSATLTGKAE